MSRVIQSHPESFFPTTEEIASGIKWIKEHPILATAAAAAATAYSVVTYLNTSKDSNEHLPSMPSWNDVSDIHAEHDHELYNEEEKVDLDEENENEDEIENIKMYERISPHGTKCICKPQLVRKTIQSEEISYGERHSYTSKSIHSSYTSKYTITSRKGKASPSNFSHEQNLESIDYSSMSPQWGWYVSTTPPEDLISDREEMLLEHNMYHTNEGRTYLNEY